MALQETPGPGEYDTAGSLESWDHAVSFKGVAHLRSHVHFTVTVLSAHAHARALVSVSVRVRVRIRVLWLTQNAEVPQLIMCCLLVYIADAVALSPTHSLTTTLSHTHTLTHSISHSPTHSLTTTLSHTHSISHSITHSPSNSLTHHSRMLDARCSPLAIRLMKRS